MNGFPSFPYGIDFMGYWDASTGIYPPQPNTDGFWIIIDSGAIFGVDYPAGSCLKFINGSFSKAQGFLMDWRLISNKPDIAGRATKWAEIPDKPVGTDLENNIVVRDNLGDATARRFKSTTYSQSEIPKEASLAFRVNPTNDSYVRFADHGAVLKYLGTVHDASTIAGKTIDDITTLARQNVVLTSVKINKKPLNQDINLTAADVGLGDVPNFKETSSCLGTSTSLLATQKAAYNASFAPALAEDRKRKITVEQREPTGSDGEDGDIWLVY